MTKTTNTNPPLIDVLVVGAGPTGLLLANELASYGCTFRIIDKLPGPSIHSKAFGIWHRSLDIFDNRKLIEPFVNEHLTFSGMILRDRNEDVLVKLPFTGLVDSKFDLPFMIPQSSTERILHEKLLEYTNGVEIIEREVELLQYEQIRFEGEDSDRIVAKVKTADKEDEIHAKFIVGCDGVHSKVRKNYEDWTYEGRTIDEEFGIIDCKLINAEELIAEKYFITTILSPDGVISFFPFGETRNVCRIIANLRTSKTSSNEITHAVPKEFKLEEMQQIVTSRLKTNVILEDPIWVTKFRINERMVNKYRHGNAFLAGDAAHCHSPLGGQGLNTGIQDAHNLGWKLHHVLHNLTPNPESLLDSYSEERLPIARAVLSSTGRATSIAMGNSWCQKFVRHNIMPYFLSIHRVNSMRINGLSGKYISYMQGDALLLNPSNWFTFLTGPSIVPAGTIAQDGPLTHSDAINPTTFYDILRGMKEHRLVFFSGSADNSAALTFLVCTTKEFSGVIKPIIITNGSVETFQSKYPNIPVYVDAGEVFHHKYGVRKDEQAMMLIRPDMFIGASVGTSEKELESLGRFLDGYLIRSA